MLNETIWVDCFFYGFYMSKELYNKYIVYPHHNLQYFDFEKSTAPKQILLIKQKSRKKCLDKEKTEHPKILQMIFFLFDFKYLNTQFRGYFNYIFSFNTRDPNIYAQDIQELYTLIHIDTK